MASFGQMFTDFLLLSFCLCCFYQPCLSYEENCQSLPSSCYNKPTDEMAQKICLHLKSSPEMCMNSSIAHTEANDNVCNHTSQMQMILPPETTNLPCQQFCKKFVDICNYLYLIIKVKTNKSGDASHNADNINKEEINSITISKKIETSLTASKDNKTETDAFGTSYKETNGKSAILQNTFDTENGRFDGPNSKTSSSDSLKPSNTQNEPDSKVSSPDSVNPSNTENGPNSKISSSDSVNPSNTRNEPNSKVLSPDSVNPSNTENGPNSKISSSGFLNTSNTENGPNSKVSSPDSVNPSNTRNEPNSKISSSDSVNPSNTRNEPNSKISSSDSVNPSNTRNGPNSKISSSDSVNPSNNGNGAGIDAAKTSATKATISPIQLNSQQKTKISLGSQKIQPDNAAKKIPESTAYNEAPSSAHFMGYFLTAIVLCIAGYIVFHNKQKIIAFIIEGRNQKRGRRPNANEYKKLQTNVDDVMVSLDKSTTAQNYIY